jgi:hypothetical protein
MKTIIAISVISVLALGMSTLPTSVYAQGDAYSKGYKDALCDKLSCNGHGYDPSCPGDHSSEYCNNYRDGYAAGWDASTSSNNNENSQSGSGDGSSSTQSQSQTTPDINIHIGPQSQAQSQSQASGN